MYSLKFRSTIFFLSFLTFILFTSFNTYSQTNDPKYLSKLVKILSPSVVNISTTSVTNGRSFSFGNPNNDPNDPFEQFFDRFFGENQQQRVFSVVWCLLWLVRASALRY